MSENLEGNWDVRVEQILASVNRQARIYMMLGYGVYGLGSAAIMWLVPDKGFATLLVMFFFQICLVYFGTQAVYPCIAGAFRVGLEANRDTVPMFEKVNAALNSPEDSPLGKMIAGKADAAKDEVKPLLESAKRITDRLEAEIKDGLFEDMREGLRELRQFTAPQGKPPSLDRGLSSIRKLNGPAIVERKLPT